MILIGKNDMDSNEDKIMSEIRPEPKKQRKPRKPKPQVTSNDGYAYPLVELKWSDAEVESDWADHDVTIIPTAPECTTVGFLIKESEDVLVVASTYEGKQTNARIKIPRAFLKSFRTLHIKDS